MELTPEQRTGLQQQVVLDKAAIERMWAHIDDTLGAINQLKARIAENEAKLAE